MHTSKKFSQMLNEAGFEGESERWWASSETDDATQTFDLMDGNNTTKYGIPVQSKFPAYDLLWDLCIKHKDIIWGEELRGKGWISYKYHSKEILSKLQNGESQDEIELYIEQNSPLFNK